MFLSPFHDGNIERAQWLVNEVRGSQLQTAQMKACRRWGHSATAVTAQSSVVVFGGHDSIQQLDDLHVLDISVVQC